MTLTAVLLVGGNSRRMGVDKATLIVNGKPLWARQLEILRQLPFEKIFVSARARPPWCPSDVEAVLDEPPSRGPLSGIAAALGKLSTTHLLALAIDLPRMTSGQLEKLWKQVHPGVGVIPKNENYFEPLCAIYPAEALASAETLLMGENVAMHGLAQKLVDEKLALVYRVEKSEQKFYHNMNSPLDPG
jgi:molybdenum cofactor guanylyltransferase